MSSCTPTANYYFTASGPEYDRTGWRRARTIPELGNAEAKVIWKRHPTGIKSNPAAGKHGPGHNGFTTTPDRRGDVLVYHARNYEKIIGDPLTNPDHGVYAKILRWKPDGSPDFRLPGSDGLGP